MTVLAVFTVVAVVLAAFYQVERRARARFHGELREFEAALAEVESLLKHDSIRASSARAGVAERSPIRSLGLVASAYLMAPVQRSKYAAGANQSPEDVVTALLAELAEVDQQYRPYIKTSGQRLGLPRVLTGAYAA